MHSHEPPYDCSSAAACAAEDCDTASRRHFLLMGMAAIFAGLVLDARALSLPPPVWRPYEPPSRDSSPLPGPTGPTLPPARQRSQWTSIGNLTAAISTRCCRSGTSPFTMTAWIFSGARRPAARVRGWRNWYGPSWKGVVGHWVSLRRGPGRARGLGVRSLAWQGAHVKDRNEGNIGIAALEALTGRLRPRRRYRPCVGTCQCS